MPAANRRDKPLPVMAQIDKCPPVKGQEGSLRRQEIESGKNIENVRDTLIPHNDEEGTDLVEQRGSLLPKDGSEIKERRGEGLKVDWELDPTSLLVNNQPMVDLQFSLNSLEKIFALNSWFQQCCCHKL